MRKVILYSAVSLDGYIARKDGSLDWLESEENRLEGEDFGYNDFYQSVDCTIMGNNTYEVILGFEVEFPYKECVNYVFTRQEKETTGPHIEYVRGEARDFVNELKRKEGKNIWLVGGGQLNAALLKLGLIDELILTQIPVILGDGIELFDGDCGERKLKLSESKSYENGIVQHTYKVIND